MASGYPASIDALATNKSDSTAMATDHAGHHNDLADAVNKIEGELGVNPSGASATVAARLDLLAPKASPTFTGNTTLARQNTGLEGGELCLNRASDNGTGWVVDVYGASATPDLRFMNSNGERVRIGGDGLITGTGTSLGAWTAYQPVLGNWAVGDGTITGAYCQIGKTIHGYAVFTAGSSSTFTSYPTMSFPVTAKSVTPQDAMHISGTAFDASAGTRYLLYSTNATGFSVPLVGNPGSTLSSTNPFTWATSDRLLITFTYQAA